MQVAKEKMQLGEEMNAEEYVDVDEDIPATEELSENWEAKLVEEVRERSVPESASADNEEDSDDELESEPEVRGLVNTHAEALRMINKLKMFSMKKDVDGLLELFDKAQDKLERQVVQLRCSARQSGMSEFLTTVNQE